ncbi:MAG: L,D-transpeptidase family protein [Alphaproteobacteria bacterium]|nr:L,D-transpeptidase family protein [Alphaproteobacteria bacterium]
MEIIVRPDGQDRATLSIGGLTTRCSVGKGGIGIKLREGDGITPIGTWALREVIYRPDRVPRPETRLPVRAMAPNDGWCEAPDDPDYNRLVRLPHRAPCDAMWREDHLYDVVCVIGYNDAPVVPGKGSAIFLHLCRTDYGPTAGCVGVPIEELAQILALCDSHSTITIKGS